MSTTKAKIRREYELSVDSPTVKLGVRAKVLRFVARESIPSEYSAMTQGPMASSTSGMSGYSGYRVIQNHPLVPVQGVFRDDPTWDSFQESIRQYNDYINALEREQE